MAVVHKVNNIFTQDLGSDFAEVDRVCSVVQAFLYNQQLQDDIFEVMLLVREGLVNAVEHGNDFDPDRNIHLRIVREQQTLTIEIEDEGEGFDYGQIIEKQTDPLSLRGRGLAILNNYADQVRFNEKGNVLIMTKKLQANGRNS